MGRRDQQPIPDTADATTEVEEQPKRKSRVLPLLLMILIPAGVGAAFAYSQYGQLVQWVTGTSDAQVPSVEEGAEPIEYGLFHEITNLVINPKDSDGRRYLMVSIGLESKSPKTLEEMQAKEIVVRDKVLKLLGLMTVEELAAIENRNRIKEDLRQAVNELVHKGEIDRLYFTQYVLQ